MVQGKGDDIMDINSYIDNKIKEFGSFENYLEKMKNEPSLVEDFVGSIDFENDPIISVILLGLNLYILNTFLNIHPVDEDLYLLMK